MLKSNAVENTNVKLGSFRSLVYQIHCPRIKSKCVYVCMKVLVFVILLGHMSGWILYTRDNVFTKFVLESKKLFFTSVEGNVLPIK